MAQKGPSKTQKSISVENARFLKRKKNTWTIRTSPGAHSKNTSVPLGFVCRDLLGLGESMFETKKILNAKNVLVNGVARSDQKFAVGLFDVIELLLENKRFRIVFDNNGRLVLSEIKNKGSVEKISKILFKKMVKGGLVQLTTNDGFVFREKKSDYKPGDSLKISLPQKKILGGFELKTGKTVYLINGENKVGKIGKVTAISGSSKSREKIINIDVDGEVLKTVERNVIVIGDNSTSIDFGKVFESEEK